MQVTATFIHTRSTKNFERYEPQDEGSEVVGTLYFTQNGSLTETLQVVVSDKRIAGAVTFTWSKDTKNMDRFTAEEGGKFVGSIYVLKSAGMAGKSLYVTVPTNGATAKPARKAPATAKTTVKRAVRK